MTDPWKDGARPQAPRAQRARMALVLALALALPALIIVGGNRRPAETTVELASAVTSQIESTEATTELSTSSEQTEPAPTTTIDETTTEAPTSSSTTAAPTTTAAPSTSSTTAKASSTTTSAAPSTTKAPTVAAAQVAAPPTTAYIPPTTAAPTTTAKPAPPAGTQSEAAFLACVRQRESGGNYGAVSPGGTYMGAYQFAQSTWDGTAQMAGRGDLVGKKPNLAAPSDQDQLAITLYRSAGAAPWGGHCP